VERIIMTESLSLWKEWNSQGFIPGPHESEVEFEKRVNFCKNLEKYVVEQTNQKLPFQLDDSVSKEVVSEAFPLTKKLYGIEPNWVLLFFSNYKLLPWHGGCAWIFQLDEASPTAAFLQLRAKFRSSSVLFGIYERKELIAHELSHVGRMMYEEPQFEELFAYQSSRISWRRWLGPIVETSREVLWFLVLLLASVIASVMHGGEWVIVAPLVMIVFGVIRVWVRHGVYERCVEKMGKMFERGVDTDKGDGDEEKGKHLVYRLLDSEIRLFGKLSLGEIREKIVELGGESFRWRFLKSVFNIEENKE
jgi:hypothetical protein